MPSSDFRRDSIFKGEKELLPKYEEEDILHPMSVYQNPRYDRRIMATKISITIQPGLSTRPQYSPAEWVIHINPEGSRYFVNPVIQVITDTAISNADRYEGLMKGIKHFHTVAANLPEALPQQTELFIQLHDGADSTEKNPKCNYYLVDHETQSEFWLHSVNPEKVGITQITSESHLKHALQEHYWVHMEYFPYRPVPLRLREELLSIFRHGQLDMMTSSTSTFPYDAMQCEKMIQLITDSLNSVPDAYTTCMIARMWATMARQRYTQFYGEEHARLERTQHVLTNPEVRRSIIMDGIIALCFGIPAKVNEKLEVLLVDDSMYGIHWQKFMSQNIATWKEARLVAIALTITNVILLVAPKGPLSTYIGLASILLSAASFISSVALLVRYTGAEEQVAAQGMEEIYRVEHPTLRYRPAAAVFSLPTAFGIWSLIVFGAEVLGLVLEFCTSWASVVMGVIFAIVVSVIVVSVAVQRAGMAWRKFRSKSKADSADSAV